MYQGTVNDLGGILRGPVPRRCENREDLGEPPKVIVVLCQLIIHFLSHSIVVFILTIYRPGHTIVIQF